MDKPKSLKFKNSKSEGRRSDGITHWKWVEESQRETWHLTELHQTVTLQGPSHVLLSTRVWRAFYEMSCLWGNPQNQCGSFQIIDLSLIISKFNFIFCLTFWLCCPAMKYIFSSAYLTKQTKIQHLGVSLQPISILFKCKTGPTSMKLLRAQKLRSRHQRQIENIKLANPHKKGSRKLALFLFHSASHDHFIRMRHQSIF